MKEKIRKKKKKKNCHNTLSRLIDPILEEVYSQGYPKSAICVQKFDDSLSSAIRINLSQFAAFFIVARAKISVVESCLGLCARG